MLLYMQLLQEYRKEELEMDEDEALIPVAHFHKVGRVRHIHVCLADELVSPCHCRLLIMYLEYHSC